MRSLGISEQLAHREPTSESIPADYPDEEAFAEGYAQEMPALPKDTTKGLPSLAGQPRNYFPSRPNGANDPGGTRPDHEMPLPPLGEYK